MHHIVCSPSQKRLFTRVGVHTDSELESYGERALMETKEEREVLARLKKIEEQLATFHNKDEIQVIHWLVVILYESFIQKSSNSDKAVTGDVQSTICFSFSFPPGHIARGAMSEQLLCHCLSCTSIFNLGFIMN